MLLGTTPALASKRVALVIGNSDYQNTQPLPNPVHDAGAIESALRKLGFVVSDGFNLTKQQMDRKIVAFSDTSQGADIALVFYAGHGLQVEGRNYLVPVDARVRNAIAVQAEAVDLHFLLDAMSPARTRLVILDACRDNPLANQMVASGRSISRGLARVESDDAGGTLIAFATRPGSVAEDGDGGNSPFTRALLTHLPEPGLEFRLMLSRVYNDVRSATHGSQEPWTEGSLGEEIYLAGTGSSSNGGGSIELAYWESVKDSTDASDFESYLGRYPNGDFADLARHKLVRLKGASTAPVQVASIVEPAPAPVPLTLNAAADEEAIYLRNFDQLRGSKYDAAILGFRAQLDKYPQGNYADNAWYWLGESYRVKGDEADALLSFQALIRQFPASPKVPDALLKIGLAYQGSGKSEQAREAFQKVVAEYPNASAATLARTRLGQLR